MGPFNVVFIVYGPDMIVELGLFIHQNVYSPDNAQLLGQIKRPHVRMIV